MSLVRSRNSYFSISDILSSQERVPCTFLKNVTHLESLDPSSSTGVLTQGSSLELPLWMAQSLDKANVANIELPNAFKPAYRDILKADANVVDLHQFSKFYYEFGRMVASCQKRGSKELMETILETFIERAGDILEKARVSTEGSSMDKLDCLERALVQRSKSATAGMDQWLTSTSGTIRMASLVSYHKKRKLIENAFS